MKYADFYREELPARQRFMDAFWRGEDVPHIPFDAYCWIGNVQNLAPLPTRMNQWLNFFNANIPYPGFFIPNFWLYDGNTVCAEMLGAEANRSQLSWRQPMSIPYIKDDYRKAERIPAPDFECETARRIEAMGRFYLEHWPYEGRPVLTMPDLQGPLDLLAQLWGEEHFFLAFYDCPDLVKQALARVTDGLIAIVEHYSAVFPGISQVFFPFKYTPPNIGVEIAEDHISTISRDLVEEFVLPCWNRISARFNGLHLHSCGNFEHQLPVLRKIDRLRSLNFSLCQNGSFAQGNPYDKVREALPDCILIPGMTFEGQDRFPTIVEYLEHVLAANGGSRKLHLNILGTTEEDGVITYARPEVMAGAFRVLARHGVPCEVQGQAGTRPARA